MVTENVTFAGWRKSSYSGNENGSNCVEVAFAEPVVGVRDSKCRAGEPLVVGRANWRAFLGRCR